MELIELSYLLSESMPKWPTNPEESYIVEQATDLGASCNASSVRHHMHNGTHVDAPRHFNPRGATIDQIPIEDFHYTSPLVLDIPKKKGELISTEELSRFESEISNADILLFSTGYAKLRENDPDAFVDDFPTLTPDAAKYLRENFPKLKALALDTLSLDSCVTAEAAGYPVHHALLDTGSEHPQRTLLLFEDVNVQKLLNKTIFSIFALPIRFLGLEAAPVSMIAFVENTK